MQTQQTQQMRLIFKILSVLIIVLSVVMIVFSAVTLAGGTMLSSLGMEPIPEAKEDQATQQMAVGLGVVAIILGVWMLLVGVFDLITGIFGYRGAKGSPRSAGKAKVMGIIALVFVTATNVHLVVNTPTFSTICAALASVCLQIFFVQSAHRLQHDNDIHADA